MGLLEDGSDTPGDVKVVDHAWRGAEAYHFLMLCQVLSSSLDCRVWHSFCLFFYSQVCFDHIGFSSEEMVGVQLNTIKGEGKPSDNDKTPNQAPSLTFMTS